MNVLRTSSSEFEYEDRSQLWKECANWLSRFGPNVVNPDIQFLNSQSLFNHLRSGVVLCSLVHHLQPNSIDLSRVSKRPQNSRFLCIENIRTFLNACKHHFGMKDRDLFDPYMLYEGTDFKQVLIALSNLSKRDFLTQRNYKPFYVDSYDTNCKLRNNRDDFRNEIHDKNGDVSSEASIDNTHLSSVHQVYKDLISSRESQTREVLSNIDSVEKEQHSVKRYVVDEFVETERNYIRTLNELINEYGAVLNAIAGEKTNISQNLQDILDLHTSLFARLTEICDQRSIAYQCEEIANLFVDSQDRFLIYGEYCVALKDTMELVKNFKQTDMPCYERLVPDRNGSNKTNSQTDEQLRRFHLEDLLAVPFQRVLKYNMLLSQMSKEDSESVEKFQTQSKAIQDALDATADVNRFINEIKRDNENLLIIREIQKKMSNIKLPSCLLGLHDYGRFLMDGRLKVATKKPVDFRARTVFMFEKVLLICKRKGESYTFKDLLNLSQLKTNDDGTTNMDKKDLIVLQDKHFKSNTYFFQSKNPTDTKLWKSRFSESIGKFDSDKLSANGHEFVYSTFGKHELRCDECRKYLTGLFLQGFRCQMCRRKVHKECIATSNNPCGYLLTKNGEQPRPIGPSVIQRRHLSVRLPQSFRLSQKEKNIKSRIPSSRAKVRHAHSIFGNPDHLRGFVQVVYAANSINLSNETKMFPVLSVNPGDIINVLEDDDDDWWMGTNVNTGDCGWFPSVITQPISVCNRSNDNRAFSTLSRNQWYLDCSREAAELLLAKSTVPNDTFLVRPRRTRSNPESLYSLSLKHRDKIYHIRILQDSGNAQKNPKVFISRHSLFSNIEVSRSNYHFSTFTFAI
ncbi:hypothetical protein ACOME3_010071 [Neoechinorhynchus agilis]